MPLYEYECDQCGHRFEAIRKFSDPPVETCPKCGGHVHKLQSAPAFHLKGTGWYATDYPKKDQSTPAQEEGAKKDAPGEKKEGAADKKEGAADKKEGAAEKSDAATKTEKPAEKSEKASTSDAPPAAKQEKA